MKSFPENYAATITVPFKDLNGTGVIPNDLKARLYDGDGSLLVDFGSIPFDPLAGKKDVVVPAAFNDLGAGAFEDMRVLRVELVTAAGSIPQTHKYLVQGERKLTLLENTFVSLEQAQIIARRVSAARDFAGAEEEAQFNALIEAFVRVRRIPLKYTLEDPVSRFDTLAEVSRRVVELPRDIWDTIDLAQFNALPIGLRSSLSAAQIVEANEILAGDEIGRRHRQGIISETVGESSIMLRGGAVDFGVSQSTLRALSGYVNYSSRVVR